MVNGWNLLTILIKSSILAILNTPRKLNVQRHKQKHWINILNVVLYVFKVNSKVTRMTSIVVVLMYLLLILNISSLTFSILIQCLLFYFCSNFEHDNVCKTVKLKLLSHFVPLTCHGFRFDSCLLYVSVIVRPLEYLTTLEMTNTGVSGN